MTGEAYAAVLYTRGPRWVADATLLAQDQVVGHLRFLRGLARDGLVRTGGPFWRLDERAAGDAIGLVVLSVPPARATALVATDPAVRHGLMVATVYAYHPLS